MDQFPAFWDAIERSLSLDSRGIKEIKEILTFCRYTTIESIVKFEKNNAIARLELEFVNRKAELVKSYPHLENFTFASGVYSILGDIASKIKKSYVYEMENFDAESISKKVLEDGKKVIKSALWQCFSLYIKRHI